VQKILITGANGHLGANLVRALVAEGAELRVLLRPESDNSPTDDLDVERVLGDLRDAASLEAATKGCRAIYHCAAQLSTASGGEQEIFASNVLGTRNLLDAARRNGVGRVVVTGSLSATGHRLDGPTDESVPFNPFERHLPYAISKAAVEHECLKAFAEGLDVVMAVSCAILGPNDFKPSRMGQVLIDHARGRLRTYIPGGFEFVAARDIVEGHRLCMGRGRAGQKYIFSTGYLTMDEIMDLFEAVTGRPKRRLRLPPGLMAPVAEIGAFVHRHILSGRRQLLTPAAVRLLRMGRRADTGKAQRELDYRPTSIVEAVREAYECFVKRSVIDRPRAGAITARRRAHDKARAGSS
jgi:nucleoside-diphosphate-sugar epimerase